MTVPFDKAYWADPGRLLAGPYPAEYDPAGTRRNLDALLRAGVRTFINLMEAREESSDASGRSRYAAEVERLAARLGVDCEWHRFEIHDMSIPERERLDAILSLIDDSLERGRPVYTHCWGGRGRTGLVVGAYLIRRGLATAEDFVDVIGRLRDRPNEPSPETAEQIEFVRSYSSSRSPS